MERRGPPPERKFTIEDRDALLVVDVQNDFCPGGALAVPEGDQVIPVINKLARLFHHVILTQDWHPAGHASFASQHPGKQPFETVQLDYGAQVLWPDHCVQATRGAEFHPALDVPMAELILRKGFRNGIDSYSAFMENDHATPTGLGAYLGERGIDRLFLTGLAYDYCVLYSALDGQRAGIACTVVADGCRAIDRDGSRAEADMRYQVSSVSRIQSDRFVGA